MSVLTPLGTGHNMAVVFGLGHGSRPVAGFLSAREHSKPREENGGPDAHAISHPCCSRSVVVLALFSVIAVGQAQAPASGASDRFQTPWGDPDLQGMLDERHDYPVTYSLPEKRTEVPMRTRYPWSKPRPPVVSMAFPGMATLEPTISTGLTGEPRYSGPDRHR